MENVTMNDKAVIIDEQLDNISGGIDISDGFPKTLCSYCKKTVSVVEITKFNNRLACKECMAKLNK